MHSKKAKEKLRASRPVVADEERHVEVSAKSLREILREILGGVSSLENIDF